VRQPRFILPKPELNLVEHTHMRIIPLAMTRNG
jgi:hypothetical protein